MENKKIKTKKILRIIAITLTILSIIFLSLYLVFKPKKEDKISSLEYSYYNNLNDRYYTKAKLKNNKVTEVETKIKYYAKDEENLKKISQYEYKILSQQTDKYQDVKLNKNHTITYKSLKDDVLGKTKEEIEKIYSEEKYTNFKWEEIK